MSSSVLNYPVNYLSHAVRNEKIAILYYCNITHQVRQTRMHSYTYLNLFFFVELLVNCDHSYGELKLLISKTLSQEQLGATITSHPSIIINYRSLQQEHSENKREKRKNVMPQFWQSFHRRRRSELVQIRAR